MTRFQEELSRALCILEAERREVVKRLQDAYRDAFVKLEKIDGVIVVPKDVFVSIISSHKAIDVMLGKILTHPAEERMLERFRLLNDAMLKIWYNKADVKPVQLDAQNRALISACVTALEEWRVAGQEAVKPIDATYVRRFNEWSAAVDDVRLAYITLASMF